MTSKGEEFELIVANQIDMREQLGFDTNPEVVRQLVVGAPLDSPSSNGLIGTPEETAELNRRIAIQTRLPELRLAARSLLGLC